MPMCGATDGLWGGAYAPDVTGTCKAAAGKPLASVATPASSTSCPGSRRPFHPSTSPPRPLLSPEPVPEPTRTPRVWWPWSRSTRRASARSPPAHRRRTPAPTPPTKPWCLPPSRTCRLRPLAPFRCTPPPRHEPLAWAARKEEANAPALTRYHKRSRRRSRRRSRSRSCNHAHSRVVPLPRTRHRAVKHAALRPRVVGTRTSCPTRANHGRTSRCRPRTTATAAATAPVPVPAPAPAPAPAPIPLSVPGACLPSRTNAVMVTAAAFLKGLGFARLRLQAAVQRRARRRAFHPLPRPVRSMPRVTQRPMPRPTRQPRDNTAAVTPMASSHHSLLARRRRRPRASMRRGTDHHRRVSLSPTLTRTAQHMASGGVVFVAAEHLPRTRTRPQRAITLGTTPTTRTSSVNAAAGTPMGESLPLVPSPRLQRHKQRSSAASRAACIGVVPAAPLLDTQAPVVPLYPLRRRPRHHWGLAPLSCRHCARRPRVAINREPLPPRRLLLVYPCFRRHPDRLCRNDLQCVGMGRIDMGTCDRYGHLRALVARVPAWNSCVTCRSVAFVEVAVPSEG